MKKNSLVFALSAFVLLASCDNATDQPTMPATVVSVAPELGPAQEAVAFVDTLVDTAKEKSEKPAEVGKIMAEDAQKEVKEAVQNLKTEVNKATNKVDAVAKEVQNGAKEATAKAAEKVEQKAKDLKENLKK